MISDQAFTIPNKEFVIEPKPNKDQRIRNSLRFALINFLMSKTPAYKRTVA